MELRSNIKTLNYLRKLLLDDTDRILPFAIRPQKPSAHGNLPRSLPRAEPRSEGVAPAALDRLLRSLSDPGCATHACIVLRHGKVIAEAAFAPYSGRYWHVTHSLCKSVTGTAIGMLIDEGRLSLDERICDIFSDQCGILTGRRMRSITVRHLLTMTSGVAFREAGAVLESNWVRAFLDSDVQWDPGTQFEYNSMNSYMLSAIVKARTGEGLCDYLRPRLFEPLGFGDIAWETCPMGIEKGGWGLYIYLEDIAKLGQLYLQNGTWYSQDGTPKRILSEEWVHDAQTPHAHNAENDEYGYQMWPRSADGLYMFNGMFGQYVVIVPGQQMVIAVNAGAGHLFTQSRSDLAVQRFLKDVQNTTDAELSDEDAAQRLSFTLSHLSFGQRVPEMPAPEPPPAWYHRLRDLFFPPKPPQPVPVIPDAVRPALAQTYTLCENRAGLIPVVIACMGDWYTKGVHQIGFEAGENSLTLFWTESGAMLRIPVGFDRAAECEIELGGSRYHLGVTGVFTQDEDETPVLKLTVCLLESSSTRLLKFFFQPDGTLTLKLSETPDLRETFLSAQSAVNAAVIFKDLNYLQYLIERKLNPVVHSKPELNKSGKNGQ